LKGEGLILNLRTATAMRLRFFILFVFALLAEITFCQDERRVRDSLKAVQEIPKLKKQISEETNDSVKIAKIIELAGLQYFNIDTALKTAFYALELATKINSHYNETFALQAIGGIYERNKNYPAAISYHKKSLDKAKEHNYKRLIYEDFTGILNLCYFTGNYPYAMETSLAALNWAESIKDYKLIGNYENLLGYIYNKQGNYNESKKYYGLYISLAEKMNDSSMMAHAYNEASDVFFSENNFEQALSYLNRSITLYKTREMYGPDRKYQGNNRVLISNGIFKISRIYKAKGDLRQALRYSLQSFDAASAANEYDLAAYNINAGDIYLQSGQIEQAKKYFHSGLAIALQIQHSEDIRDAYYYLSQLYKEEKKFDSAYYYYGNYVSLKDSIVNERTRQSIAFMQSQFDTERKDRQIEDQQAELNHQSLLRNLIIGSSVFLLVILILFYNRYRLRQKNKFQQQLNKQQNELMNTVIAAQDKERKRIAEDLHDTLGSILSAAKLKLSAISEPANGNGQNNYDDTMNLLDEAVNEMRSISHNLLPASLLRLGLIAGLQNLFDKISFRSGLKISFIAHGFKQRIDENIEVSMYRIVLEAVNNIVKHANAKNVTVQLMQYDRYINMLIEDDGVGFDKDLALKEQGIGLNNIFSRVDYMKGKVDIDTRPKAGTVINIDIPYAQAN
jgi:signal transduction histidine kinase